MRMAHGGYVFLLADTAFACACNSHGPVTVAAGADITFLRPVRAGDVLEARAAERVVSGRSGIYDVTVTRGDDVVAEFRGRSRSGRQPRRTAGMSETTAGRPRRGRPGHDQDAVLMAAVRLFNDRGYEATSMGDLAETPRHHQVEHLPPRHQQGGPAADGGRPCPGRAVRGGRPGQDHGPAGDRPARAADPAQRAGARRPPRVRHPAAAGPRQHRGRAAGALLRRRIFDAQVTELVKQAQAEGDLRADVDPATAARLLFGMVNSLTEWYRPRRGGAEAMADTVATIAFEGLRTRSE